MVKKAVRDVVFDVPVWGPLEDVLKRTVGIEKCRFFMYMGKVALGEIWVFLYKHIHTRRYLNLDGQGNAYELSKDGHYYTIDLKKALDYVFS